MLVKILTLLCLVQCSIQRSTPESDSYVAGVVEFLVSSDTDANLVQYISLIKDAAQQDVDIVVFPELTLTNRTVSISVPINGLLKEKPIPALYPEDYDKLMVQISAAARENQVYVVINGQEIVDCSISVGEDCPEDKVYLYNTNVVFDRQGAVIDRYRKINLFGEFARTSGKETDLGIFSTDFGVTFGHFICFDLMFQVPAVQVVEKYNLTDVVFTTMWFSESPYLVSTGIQEAFAYAMNVNFLGAGANNVRIGSGGSGIYSGHAGALISIMPGQPTTRLMVSRVPKIPGQVANIPHPGPIPEDPAIQDQFSLIGDPSIPSHVSKLLTVGSQEIELVDKEVTCKIKATLTQRDGEVQYNYLAAAFDGVRSFSGMATGGTRVCSVFACTGTTIDTCPQRFQTYSVNSTAIFEELTIVAYMPTPVTELDKGAVDSAYFPVSLDVSLLPLEPKDYQYSQEVVGNKTVYTFTLNSRDAELYTFSVWGRVFVWDGDEATPPLKSSSVVYLISSLVFLCSLTLLLRN